MSNHIMDGNQGIQPNQQQSGQSSEAKPGGGQVPPLSLLEAALDYAKDGWAVLPLHSAAQGTCSCGKKSCATPGKHPRTKNGYKDASTDASIIEQWWTRWPDANIGLATGKVSGRVVLDVDVKKGKKGDVSLQALVEEHWALPETRQAQTPTGGWHFVFQAPQGSMGSPLNVRSGIDILADGRYFVAAPSMIDGLP